MSTDPLQYDMFVGVPRVHVRLVREAVHSYDPRTRVSCPADVAASLEDYFLDRATEEFVTVNLSSSNAILNVAVISRGGLAASIVEPRAVFQAAILSNAASIICAHQHPSLNPEPSTDDVRISRQLCEAGRILGIPVRDHLILAGRGTYTSLAERGLLP